MKIEPSGPPKTADPSAGRMEEGFADYRGIVESHPGGLVVVSREGQIEFANPGAERMLRREKGQLEGGMIGEPVGGRDPEEVTLLRADGSAIAAELRVSEMKWRGSPAWLVSLQDVTRKKRGEEELKRTNEKLLESVTQLEKQAAEITLLSRMGEELQLCQSEKEAYRVAGEALEQLFAEESGALCMKQANDRFLEVVAAWGRSAVVETVFLPDDCWALRRGRPHYAEYPKSVLQCEHIAKANCRASLCVPMMAQGEALGILLLGESAEEPANTSPGEKGWEAKQHLAMTSAEQIGLALANLRLREKLREQSIRDPLTGLFNRRFMEEWLSRAMRRAQREKLPLSVLMIDLDGFKRFNDTHGHDAGDALLKAFGEFLPGRVRGGDVLCRYGGEEFALILADTDEGPAYQRGEHLRRDMQALEVWHQGKALKGVTLSVGVATYPQHGETAEELLRASDRALYEAKTAGRDRVMIAGALRMETAAKAKTKA